MFKRLLKNKNGTIETACLIVIGAIFLSATIETAQNGVMKKNGQKIWCKMQNKGNDFCDAKYQ